MGASAAADDSLKLALVSDTHGIFDPQLAKLLRDASSILHAGDVGHHGHHADLQNIDEHPQLHAEVLEELRRIAPVLAVRGNVDDCASAEELPEVQIETFNGWCILMTHIVGMPPKVAPGAQALVAEHKPDVVIFGHSHVYGEQHADGVWYINPGSAGPARFRLSRTAALLHLPAKQSGRPPHLQRLDLAGKAPSRHLRGGGSTADVHSQKLSATALKWKHVQAKPDSRKRKT